MNLSKYNTSLSLNKDIYFLVKSLSMQLQMKGHYINPCDIAEVGMKTILESYRKYLSQEQNELLDTIQLPTRLPKL